MPFDEMDNNPSLPAAPEWPPLDRSLLGEGRLAPVAFPLHLLPGAWRTWVEAASQPFGSADLVAHCLLAAVSGVCGAAVRVEVVPHWQEPLLLWHALVGGPSSGKSASFARLRGVLASVEPPKRGIAQEVPVVVVDGDARQAAVTLFRSPRGVLLWRADLADWMAEARQRAERPAWLAAWSAAPALVDRRGHDCFAVGIAGALLPERLAPGFVDGDSALAARFLYVWPGSGREEGGIAAGRLPSLAAAAADDDGLVALLQNIADVADHRDEPAIVRVDPAALTRLEGLMAELRHRAGAGEGSVEAEWIAKGVSSVVRLAGLLALMRWSEDDAAGADDLLVGLADIDAAHALWSDYYLPQAQAVFERGGVVGCERAARRVARWLRRVQAAEISREDVRRQALCQTVNAEGAEDVLARLEVGGVLRCVETRTPGRTRRRWQVNPALR
jgi:hypothetical protein